MFNYQSKLIFRFRDLLEDGGQDPLFDVKN